MIHIVLDTIVANINEYLNIKISENDRVVQNSLLNQDGTLMNNIENSVVLSLVNVEEERLSRDQEIKIKQPDGSIQKVSPGVKLNLYLFFTANFPSGYNEAVKSISYIISFFQAKSIFDRSNTPGLDPNISRIVFELYTMSFEQINHIWGALGAKLIPSVMYRARVITIKEGDVEAIGEPIREIVIEGEDKNA
jgi:hypothetical protein